MNETLAKAIIGRLGTVKNEGLVFAILASIVLVFGAPEEPEAVGAIMRLSTLPMLGGFGGFYIWATINLPSSSQERAFAEEARSNVEEHERLIESGDAPEDE